ncbi:MAG: JAB domain-containing protein [Sedimenticola sp.]
MPQLRERDQKIVDDALAILAYVHQPGEEISSPQVTQKYLRLRLADCKNEVFGGIFLSNRHNIIATEELFFGTISGASVYPRVLVQRALEHNASALILYHNHPSGVAEPSRADEQITKRIVDALALIDVRILDHVVVGSGGCTSFAERGLI